MNELRMATVALAVLQQAVSVVGDDDLERQTPCRDYTVAALAGHLVDSVGRLSAAAGVTAAASTGGPPLRRLLDAGAAAVAGWERRGVDGAVPFGARTMAAADLLGVIALEFAVHGWDFAAAVGAALVVPDELSVDLLALAHRTVTAESRRSAGFDAPIALADGATALDRLLAFTGRDPAARALLR